MFCTNARKISGSRFDPKSYDVKTKILKEAIIDCQFTTKTLRSLIIQDCSGDWGVDENEGCEESGYKKCLVIRATEFDNEYNLNLDNSRVKYRLINQNKLSKMDVKENDLLIEKSGGSPNQPVGRIAILSNTVLNKEDTNICYSNFIHKIRVDKEIVNPKYVFYFLKTIHNIKLTESMQSQTNGIRNLIMNDYYNQNIPLPNAEIQKSIVLHISDIYKNAKQLQVEANQILQQTKSDIEKMMLGV